MISRESDVRKAGLHEIAQFLAPRNICINKYIKNNSNPDSTLQTKNNHMYEEYF